MYWLGEHKRCHSKIVIIPNLGPLMCTKSGIETHFFRHHPIHNSMRKQWEKHQTWKWTGWVVGWPGFGGGTNKPFTLGCTGWPLGWRHRGLAALAERACARGGCWARPAAAGAWWAAGSVPLAAAGDRSSVSVGRREGGMGNQAMFDTEDMCWIDWHKPVISHQHD